MYASNPYLVSAFIAGTFSGNLESTSSNSACGHNDDQRVWTFLFQLSSNPTFNICLVKAKLSKVETFIKDNVVRLEQPHLHPQHFQTYMCSHNSLGSSVREWFVYSLQQEGS